MKELLKIREKYGYQELEAATYSAEQCQRRPLMVDRPTQTTLSDENVTSRKLNLTTTISRNNNSIADERTLPNVGNISESHLVTDDGAQDEDAYGQASESSISIDGTQHHIQIVREFSKHIR